ncbi:lipid-A-disaccharide synthase [Rhizobium leguminosarum]|jgi:lipid-A-disaccharide synthase|uniref:lipid-A-disaccharide synthase n=1 Tax=Rhizobium TaxID=379 RepID=UPI00103C2CD4|nr:MULTISPECIES: lipid-A-disaccharide synthase [Rhizobium]MCJ9696784.1 lipid-A-disaccharide synthase [Rhizobium sp. PRIMUS64]NKJ95235.1 lipid-A-disaccharide synthase [Rhizobium leguminosarum bv. viciae]NKK03089.1 lipid-A-disaccharide synthase [Rhizobium leguminosarum bv. viciae]NKK88683.1 lipid-A-disaccharide synthase [Rhizobium leguminosarum bv. viciae]QIO57189.1 lipid-A-disaccharide synthase [Rhizobium leguminosarum bv. trifolii]
MNGAPLKIAVIAGEVSGDLLGADLIAALKRIHRGPVELVGVGGEGLQAEGLRSLFDFSELSIMGITQVLSRLPKLYTLIRQTTAAIIAAKPDILLIIDSPDFTHRVAKRVRTALPDLPVVNYVCPSVWAWKEYRATRMLGYVDHVLAVLPFEPAVMRTLGGPETTYVGHRLTADPALLEARRLRAGRAPVGEAGKTILMLPGSRSSEISRLLPFFEDAARELVARNGPMRFLLPTVPHNEALVKGLVAGWATPPEVVVGSMQKWKAFAEADAAMAASGTVILELGLAGVPTVSVYKTDWIISLLTKRIKVWTGALPNIIADYAVVPEYLNEVVRGASLARWMERLSADTLQLKAMNEGYDLVWQRMQTEKPPGEHAAEILLDVLEKKKPGHF